MVLFLHEHSQQGQNDKSNKRNWHADCGVPWISYFNLRFSEYISFCRRAVRGVHSLEANDSLSSTVAVVTVKVIVIDIGIVIVLLIMVGVILMVTIISIMLKVGGLGVSGNRKVSQEGDR